jgi:hypothetical protein
MNITHELACEERDLMGDAKTKVRFAQQFCKFVTGHFSKRDFPCWFHKLLSSTFGLDLYSQYSRSEFYYHFFSTGVKQGAFLRQCLSCSTKSDPVFSFSDANKCLQKWLDHNLILAQVIEYHQHHSTETEREILCRLVEKYGGKHVRQILHLLEDNFPEYDGDLGDMCVQLGADPAAVGSWPDFKRKQFIELHSYSIPKK